MRIQKGAQIDAILSDRAFAVALSHLPGREALNDLCFDDLMDVTPTEVLQVVDDRGFDPRTAVELAERDRVPDDRIVVRPDAGRWEVFYFERGEKNDLARFASREEARAEVVRRLFSLAWISLNAWYRDKHFPGMPIPPYGESFPPTARGRGHGT